MKRPWSYEDLKRKTKLPKQKGLTDAEKEDKKRKAATKKAEAEKERQEFIDFIFKNTGLRFIPEYRFHPERNWRYDFVCLENNLNIAIEIDGGLWMEKSGHNTGVGISNAMEKRNSAVVMGFKPIHITPQQRLTPYIVDLINRIVACREMDLETN